MPKKLSKRIKPTLDTPFYIDYDWWENEGRNLRVYLLSHLSADLQDAFSQIDEDQRIDFVDPETGEVRRVDALQQAIQFASQNPDFITYQTSLVDSVFRAFLANGNKPLTPVELGNITGRQPMTILRTLGGRRVYRGLLPYIDED
jgi:hypothetical protein